MNIGVNINDLIKQNILTALNFLIKFIIRLFVYNDVLGADYFEIFFFLAKNSKIIYSSKNCYIPGFHIFLYQNHLLIFDIKVNEVTKEYIGSIIAFNKDITSKLLKRVNQNNLYYVDSEKIKVLVFNMERQFFISYDTYRELATDYIIDQKELEIIDKECDIWRNSSLFKTLKIPKRKVYLLYGIPGTGKSTFVEYIAKKYGLIIRLISLKCATLFALQRLNLKENPGILLFEDIDCIYEKRKEKEKYLPFDDLINFISTLDNQIVFITTNNIEKLDEALLRSRRIDRKVLMNERLSKETKYKMASAIIKDEKLVEQIVQEENLTPADFHQKCIDIATEEFWKNNS